MLSVIISPWKRSGPSIWTNLNPLHPRMLCAKFGWNWPSGSRGEDFKFLSKNLSIFPYYLPLENSGALACTNLSPLLCQLWLKLAQWFWRNRFFKFVMYFPYFLIISPWKGAWPFIFTNRIPFTYGFSRSLVEIGWVVLENKTKMWKVYNNNDTTTNGQLSIRKAYLSFQLRRAKNEFQHEFHLN